MISKVLNSMGQKNVLKENWHRVVTFILLSKNVPQERENKHYHLLPAFHKRKDIFLSLKGENEREDLQQSTFIFKENVWLYGCCIWGTLVLGQHTWMRATQGLNPVLTFLAKLCVLHGVCPLRWRGTFFSFIQRSFLLTMLCANKAASAQKGQLFLICAKHFWSWQWPCTLSYFLKCHWSLRTVLWPVPGMQ